MAPQAHLVLIETSGNQAYIFGTNRLREQVGASEIVRRIGTKFVLCAVAGETGRSCLYDDDADTLANNLRDPKANPAIEGPDSRGVEVVVATSGKALLLVDRTDRGERIVAAVTERALCDAPGAVVRGCVGEPFPFDKAGCLDTAVKQVHQEIERLRADLPASQARFPGLPVLQPCDSSGLPANEAVSGGESQAGVFSATVWAKRRMREVAKRRFSPLEASKGLKLAFDANELEDLGSDWLGYVHADGNGLGAIFLALQDWRRKAGRPATARAYIDDYRHFSLALEACTNRAFWAAVTATVPAPRPGRKREARLVPLILGGDDLTVVCDGRQALSFAAEFLTAFERETRAAAGPSGEALTALSAAATGSAGLAACAGVAIVKPHFPAHRAYELAEALIGSAKSGVKTMVGDKNERRETLGDKTLVVRPTCSALDVHVHFDSSGADLEQIRAAAVVEDGGTSKTVATAKPYVVTAPADLDALAPETRSWIAKRRWDDLVTAADQLSGAEKADRDDSERLPRNQQHYLREGVFLGRAAADARLTQIRHRYRFRWTVLNPVDDRSLFFDDDAFVRTRLLDALELAELQRGSNDR